MPKEIFNNYLYGETIKYEYSLIEVNDCKKLKDFFCGNAKLDYFIHNELIINHEIYTDDGLPYKVFNLENGEIISIFSLATSGIVCNVDTYVKIIPAIKIDIFATDIKYQKILFFHNKIP